MNSIAVSTMASQAAMSVSMQLLWNLINVMQLIVFLQLFNLAFPANTILFYGFLRDLSNFELIPSGFINNAIYGENDQKI